MVGPGGRRVRYSVGRQGGVPAAVGVIGADGAGSMFESDIITKGRAGIPAGR